MMLHNNQERAPFTVEELTVIEVARQFFWYFLDHVFLKSFEGQTYTADDGAPVEFGFSMLHYEWALLAQVNPRLLVLAPRLHLKTTILAQAYAFWQMFRTSNQELRDIYYFSYKAELAQEKVEDLLRWIRSNPYCRFWRDMKPHGRTEVDFIVDFGKGALGETTMQGAGIFSATRGRHPKVTICDDILSDFANPLASADLERINRIFRQAIMSLPANDDDPLIVVGTPQSYDDILYQLASSEDFLWLMYPAIIDDLNQLTQWPEKFTYSRLQRIKRNVGPTPFEVEYQLLPVRTLDQFFTRDDILGVTDRDLPEWDIEVEFVNRDLATYGGFDVGRHVHPSYAAVLLELPNGSLIQVYKRFMDQMRYNTQVKTLNQIARTFSLNRGYYDATFNPLEDRDLDKRWRGRPFSRKLKADMAVLLEKRVFAEMGDPGLVLLNDQRQLQQLITVDKALNAATTVAGHGDAFWGLGLAVKAAEDGPSHVDIGSANIRGEAIRASAGANAWARQMAVSR